MGGAQTKRISQNARILFFQREEFFARPQATLCLHGTSLAYSRTDSRMMLMDSRKLTAAMVHGFAMNMKLIEDGFRAKDFFIERSGIRSSLTPNHPNTQIVGNLDQSMEEPCANATNAFMHSSHNMWMDRHKVHDQAVTPTATAVSQS
jgi:hypothetical protein